MVDGKTLIQPETRQLALHRTKRLMERIAAFLEVRVPPIKLVISWRDFGKPDAETIEILMQKAASLSITMDVIHIASFADDGEVTAGTGVANLISSTIKSRYSRHLPFWPDSKVSGSGRAVLKFRNKGDYL